MIVSLTINGQRVYVEEGTTIYQAAGKIGVFIPTLCYHPQLRPLGYCRMCLVEVNGIKRPVTSCNTLVTDGMEVTTDTPEVIASRREILSFLLSTHPVEECLTCEESGSCQLQEGAYKTGINPAREFYPVGADRSAVIDDSDYYIYRDPDKCILCGRCIRACREIANRFVFDLNENGVDSRVDFGRDESKITLEDAGCISCGICVEVCPVGALVEKGRLWQGREWEFEEVAGVCNHCGVGCMLSYKVKDNRVVKINAAEESDNPGIRICVKGKFGFDYLQSEERITTPLIRKGDREKGELQETTWEEALEYAARRFKEIKEKSGGQSLAVLSSGRLTNEESYLLQKLARAAMGTNNLEIGVYGGFENASLALDDILGVGGSTSDLEAISLADTLVLWGSDITKTHPVAAMDVQSAVRYRGARLVVINTAETEINQDAHLKLQPKAGTYNTLVKGLLRIVLEGKSEELDGDLKKAWEELSSFTLDKVAAETAVSEEDIQKAASYIMQARKALTLVGEDFVADQGYENTAALAQIHLAVHQIEDDNAGILLMHEKSNNQGGLDLGGIPELLPGFNRMDDAEARKNFAELWQVELPSAEGYNAEKIYKGAAEGEIKGLYMVGDNRHISNEKQGRDAYSGLEFLVVQELFLTPATRYADVVLPGASFLETEGTFTNLEGVLQQHDCALDPPAQALPDWKIIAALSSAMGYEMDYRSPVEVDDEIMGAIRLEGVS